MSTLAIIQGCEITREFQDEGTEVVAFTADADIDCDGGGGNPKHDPYFQPDTTLHNHGKPLVAEVDKYVVVPPIVVRGTRGVVLGCRVTCRNLHKDITVDGVVGDLGPTRKIGEVSVAMAEALGLDGDPNDGGTDEHIIQYIIYPGQAAEGYTLQPS